jgi:type II secretory pathway pseudopilin PulG
MTIPSDPPHESGVTLVELVVVVVLLTVVTALFTSTMLSTQSAVNTAASRSVATANVRVVLAQLDREVRSANAIYDPQLETDSTNALVPGMAFRAYTQADASGTSRCVHWRIAGTALQRRTWAANWRTSGDVTSWATRATNIVNAASSPPVSAFRLASQGAYGGRLLDISLVVASGDRNSLPAYADLSLEARNAVFRSSGVCADTPPPA